jgi:hypothetical protein
MSDDNPIRHQIDDVLNNAVDMSSGQAIYINNARVRTNLNEVHLDLYQTLATHTKSQTLPEAKLLHRIVLPINLAKDLARIIEQGLDQWEQQMGITLPFTPIDVESSSDESDSSNE